ncbi:VPLPA-CTERM sorting domain-containing protein [Rubellimicrobium aerolatum]|uniref:VPLPA-CTERM sorting domain-containing protein n=1 Tax=Rubellimicrobium aerolatum TaxID=490979 RepID=A0ABW0S9S7_9RHOB|nr:VPLPA-CTERM sorting domain-containing protein [Rubellimicrobium aerolatum]MBP1805008.1 hypothetical protein [Rubellimicrobium aerolatum]
MLKTLLATAALLAATTAGATPVAPLLVNGDFEDGLTGWTATAWGDTWIGAEVDSGPDGSANLGAGLYAGAGATLSQSFATTAGHAYALSFWSFNSWWGDVPILYAFGDVAGEVSDIPRWIETTATVVASSAITTLTFTFDAADVPEDYNAYLGLDDVTITDEGPAAPAPVPLPASGLLLMGALAGAGALRRKRAA